MIATHNTRHDGGHDAGHDTGHDTGHGDGHDGGHDAGHGDETATRSRAGHRPGQRTIQRTAHGRSVAAPRGASPLAGWLRGTVVVVVLAVVLLPFFFVIYRMTLFDTVPRDDYAPFLLGLLGLPGGQIPGSPHGFRVLSVLAAVPFYVGLPWLPLPHVPAGLSPYYVRATVALALLSHLAMAGTVYAAYRLARDRAGQDAATALLAAALLFVLCWYSQVVALDPVAILLITVGLYLLSHWRGFALLMLATPVINENIAIVFALWLSLRCATSAADREGLALQWVSAMAALLLYAALIAFAHLPGDSFQLEPDVYLETLRRNLAAYASPPTLMLNVLPATLLLGLGLLGHVGRRRRPAVAPSWRGLFRPVDLLVIPGMVAIALVFMPFFQVGQVLMHVAPLFVVPAAGVLLHRIASQPAAESHPP